MRSNKVIWAAVAGMGFILIIVMINKINAPEKAIGTATNEAPPVPGASSGKKRGKGKGEGDTIAETLKSIQGQYKDVSDENAVLRNEVERLNRELGETNARVAPDKGNSEFGNLVNEVDGLSTSMNSLNDKLRVIDSAVRTTAANGYEFSMDELGFGDAAVGNGKSPRSKKKTDDVVEEIPLPSGYTRVKVMSASQMSKGPTGSQLLDELNNRKKKALKDAPSINSPIPESRPVKTIPERATLIEATSMTALIGSVPVGGRIHDPFPVKIVLGDKNLATNGLSIPGLKGIVFEGFARGNWNLSCVTVQLSAATYTFQDGRIQHLYANSKGDGKSNAARMSPIAEGSVLSNAIGYVSDPAGVQCISGKRITDAHKQLFTMGLLGAASSYFQAKADAETTRQTNPLGGSSTVVDGDTQAFAANQTYSDVFDTAQKFWADRMRDTWDVIYAPPGTKLSLHITSDLYIDYNESNRFLQYSSLNGGSENVLD